MPRRATAAAAVILSAAMLPLVSASHAGAGILRLRGGMDCLPVAGAMMSKEKRAAIKAYLEKQERLKKQNFDWMDGDGSEEDPDAVGAKRSAGNSLTDQAGRLNVLLEAKKKYEKSKAAVDELVAAGIMTEAEAAKELKVANDALDKARSVTLKSKAECPKTRQDAEARLEEAINKNDPKAIESAVAALKELDEAKVQKYGYNPTGHWGAHTLGRVHAEHRLQEAIQSGDAEAVEACVAELKMMEDASQEEDCSISG